MYCDEVKHCQDADLMGEPDDMDEEGFNKLVKRQRDCPVCY
jgi:hypothetical protein